MSDESPVATTRSRRRQRAPRMSGEQRERAILEAAEALMQSHSLHEISVEEIAAGAGISRSSFYAYFASKEAVLLSLLDQVTAEADAARERALIASAEAPIADRYRAGISAFHETFRSHRSVVLVAAEARAELPEVRELWSQVMEQWVAITTDLIDARRDVGADLPVSSRELAVALNLMNERVLHATYARERVSLAEDRVVETLSAIWLAAINEPAGDPEARQQPTGGDTR